MPLPRDNQESLVLINLNGAIVPKSEAKISIFDHGFLYGDSIYETIRTYEGKPFLLNLHLERLEESGKGIHLKLPLSLPQLGQEIIKTLEGAQYPESHVRIMITRGEGDFGYDPKLCGHPNFLVFVSPLLAPPPEIYDKGVTISLVSVRRNLPSAINPAVKSGNLLNQALAWIEGQKDAAYEALMLNYKGDLAECTMSNIFFVKGEVVQTPSLDCGILAGLTRKLVLEIARTLRIPVNEGAFSERELLSADEAFLTATSREVIPIVRCNDHVIGRGIPGPVTQRLHGAYRQKVRELMEESH
jgi:branched-chain amino acid aminotransferase